MPEEQEHVWKAEPRREKQSRHRGGLCGHRTQKRTDATQRQVLKVW